MGVTYKALDVDLRCPVTLKVISEKYLGDESAQFRFLREARAAASLRHPNVASVLHLGKNGDHYFYAMEFVEGETLENLVRRSGPLDVKLALEIASNACAAAAGIVSGRWSRFSLAVICGCNAGLFREALHEVYIPRIQRGNASFAANVLGARGALLSVLVHFFEARTLGLTRGNGRRGAKSHCGRSALHSHAGGAIPNGHARIGSTGGANLLRARGVLVSFA